MENNKILIIDDNSENIRVLANILTDNNYDVEFTLNGKDALKMVASEDFDLILLDITMPGMDGFEVCKRIKEDLNKKEIPIIFLTARIDIESIQKAYKCGGLDYVSKPFNSEELLARVRTHVELKVSKDKLKEVNKWLEEKVAEKTAKLSTANKKLLELDNAKSQFIQIISHEIRTPLNGILGAVYLMKDLDLPEESIRFINMLDKSTTRLEEFSIKTLDISQFSLYEKKVIKPEKKSITPIISKVITDLESLSKSKEICISPTINTDNEVINVDPDYFYKGLFNIIHNAIKFSQDKGSVSVDVWTQDKNLVIEIKDEGIGFDKGYKIKDIELFDSKKHIDKNPGLSLYLSNQIIKAHGGSIENGNNPKKGAFVKVLLPIN